MGRWWDQNTIGETRLRSSATTLQPAMALVFRYLEPFANSLLAEEIATMVPQTAEFEWTKETFFGGLYQKVVGVRRS